MKKETALKIIFYISIAGMLFSGYLSYGEIFQNICTAEKLNLGSCTNVAGIPACVYGFVMYLIVFAVSIIGLKEKR